MKTLKDSFEVREAAKLFDELLAQSAVVAPAAPKRKIPGRRVYTSESSSPAIKKAPLPEPIEVEEEGAEQMYRGDRLENALYAMCKRGGFRGSVIVDSDGLPLAVYNSPVEEETLAAVTTVLGAALGQAGQLLNQTGANTISMDIDYVDKVVIRRFSINDLPYFLLTICPQEVDERAEVELSIDKVASILKKA